MKRNYPLFTIYCLLLTVFLSGCGSGPGQPGSAGTEDTGVLLSTSLTPTYNGKNTSDVDAFQDICTAATATTPAVYEKIYDHQATVTITATLLNPTPQITPGTLYIDYYTVEYRRSQDSIGAPPIESDTRYDTIIITPPLSGTGSTTTTFTAIFVDLTRKAKYSSNTLSGAYSYTTLAYLNNYTATYTFVGHNQYGKSFSFMAQVDFQIGDFNNC